MGRLGVGWVGRGKRGLGSALFSLHPPFSRNSKNPPMHPPTRAPHKRPCRSEADQAAVRSYLRPKAREAPYEPSTLPGARFPHCAVSVEQPGSLDLSAAPSERLLRAVPRVWLPHVWLQACV